MFNEGEDSIEGEAWTRLVFNVYEGLIMFTFAADSPVTTKWHRAIDECVSKLWSCNDGKKRGRWNK